jgi:hypothetical protein
MSTPDVRRAHRGGVYALVVAATVTAFLAVLAIWVQRQVLDGDNWTASSSRLLEDPAIRTAVSGYLVDQLYANVDVAGELRARLPAQTKGLAGPAAGGLRSVAGNLADQALQRPRVQAAWELANKRAHARLLQVLNGGGSVVSTGNGEVAIDLRALLTEIDARAGIGGRLAGRLPPRAANLVVLRSNQLKAAQNVASALRPLAIGLTALALVLYALAIWLASGRQTEARWRREALRAAGVGLIVAGIGALLVRRVAGDQVTGALASTATIRPAIASVWRIETSLLQSVAQATIAYGVVAVFAAWIAGPTAWAIGARRSLAPYLRDPTWAWSGLAIIVLILLVWAPTQALRQPVTALLLIVILAGGFEVLRRQTAREFPAGERRMSAQLRTAVSRLGGWGAHNGHGDGGATAPPATAAAAPVDPIGRLEQVAEMHKHGALSDEEFALAKRAILAADGPVSAAPA